MLSEEGKLGERTGEMARAGCRDAGKGWVTCRQQGSKPFCRYQNVLLFASKTAGILCNPLLQDSCGIKGFVVSGQIDAYQGGWYVW